ncbi:hypothetical protein ACFSHP_25495 [Novosphingobium panipatense]
MISRYDISLDIGPTRHGITRGQTIYFFDPRATGTRRSAAATPTIPTIRAGCGRPRMPARRSSITRRRSTTAS